jgi:hypothetical protein
MLPEALFCFEIIKVQFTSVAFAKIIQLIDGTNGQIDTLVATHPMASVPKYPVVQSTSTVVHDWRRCRYCQHIRQSLQVEIVT